MHPSRTVQLSPKGSAARSVAWCSASIWSAPVGSGLLTLGAPSIPSGPDGTSRIVWMINGMIKHLDRPTPGMVRRVRGRPEPSTFRLRGDRKPESPSRLGKVAQLSKGAWQASVVLHKPEHRPGHRPRPRTSRYDPAAGLMNVALVSRNLPTKNRMAKQAMPRPSDRYPASQRGSRTAGRRRSPGRPRGT